MTRLGVGTMMTLTCILTGSINASVAIGQAFAQDCKQERAIYTDDAKAYHLIFSPVDSQSAAISHRFSITIDGSKLVLDGNVMQSDPLGRPFGTILNHCPDGDVTGADIAACTVWNGVIYGHTDGEITPLPPEGAAAAKEILLPDFGSALVQSSAWGSGKANVAPWDVLSLTGCAP